MTSITYPESPRHDIANSEGYPKAFPAIFRDIYFSNINPESNFMEQSYWCFYQFASNKARFLIPAN